MATARQHLDSIIAQCALLQGEDRLDLLLEELREADYVLANAITALEDGRVDRRGDNLNEPSGGGHP